MTDRTKSTHRLCARAAALYVCATAALAAPQATFQVIEPNGPDVPSLVSGLARNGRVVTGVVQVPQAPGTPFVQVPYRWTPYRGFERLVGPGDSYLTHTTALSDSGLRVVGSAFTNGSYTGYVWDVASGARFELPLPYPGQPGFGGAQDVTPDGATIVGSWDAGLQQEGWIWTAATGTVGFGDLPGGFSQSAAAAVTHDGQVVVGSGSVQYPLRQAVRWTAATGLVSLGDLAGGTVDSYARDVDADGDVIVGGATTALGVEAFRWTASGGMVSLGRLPQQFTSEATYVSADGDVVCGLYSRPDPSQQSGYAYDGWIWTPSTGMALLSDRLTQLGATGVAGWRLIPAALSDDGTVVGGYGYDPSGRARGWVAYLAPLDERVGAAYCAPTQPNSTGNASQLDLVGLANVHDDALFARASSLPPGAPALALVSRAPGLVVMPGGSDGNLCLGGAIGRYVAPGQIQLASPTGTFELALALDELPTPGGLVSASPGETWYFQVWHRDGGPATGSSNFTNGVSVTFE
ncbi:MAG: hypothetical protein R3F49_13820 [Planctomycetota bacterium]